MTVLGANADQLEALAIHLENSARDLEMMLTQGAGSLRLTSLSSTVSEIWKGPRSRAFADVWSTRHLPKLRTLEKLLRDAATNARTEAKQQRSTSEVDRDLAAGPSAPVGGAGAIFGSGLFASGPSAQTMVDRLRGLVDDLGTANDLFEARHVITYALMVGGSVSTFHVPGLADIGHGLALHHGDEERARFFASSKGGLKTALGRSTEALGVGGTSVERLKGAEGTIAIEGVLMVAAGVQHGVGSSEFAEQTVKSSLDVGASYAVPFLGPAALDGGIAIGGLIYNHTGVGEWMMKNNPVTDRDVAAAGYNAQADMAITRKDFASANRLNDQAMQEAAQATKESSGWKGLWNALL